MKKEMASAQGSYTYLDLFQTPTMRTMTICVSAVWYGSQLNVVQKPSFRRTAVIP